MRLFYTEIPLFYNPKCVRSAVGNLWENPVVQIKVFQTLKKHLISYNKIATLPKGLGLKNLRYRKSYLIMFGSEAEG